MLPLVSRCCIRRADGGIGRSVSLVDVGGRVVGAGAPEPSGGTSSHDPPISSFSSFAALRQFASRLRLMRIWKKCWLLKLEL
eukprot:9058943-Pyramimonas_sp.AAC.1